MKYKNHIATGALAISLLVGGSNVLASSPKDLGIKNVQSTYQRPSKGSKNIKIGYSSVIGTVEAIKGMGFMVKTKNIKTKIASSVDVKSDITTLYKKNGINASISDLVTAQKVIVVGLLDQTTNIMTAKTVKIIINNKHL